VRLTFLSQGEKVQTQLTIDDFFTELNESRAAARAHIKIVEVVVNHDGAQLFADGVLELALDRDPDLDTYYRVSEIESCFIDQLVFAGTVDDRLTDQTDWVRNVVAIDNI
jgi:putative component of toxin-antitoxin plasmid stabilization module